MTTISLGQRADVTCEASVLMMLVVLFWGIRRNFLMPMMLAFGTPSTNKSSFRGHRAVFPRSPFGGTSGRKVPAKFRRITVNVSRRPPRPG